MVPKVSVIFIGLFELNIPIQFGIETTHVKNGFLWVVSTFSKETCHAVKKAAKHNFFVEGRFAKQTSMFTYWIQKDYLTY